MRHPSRLLRSPESFRKLTAPRIAVRPVLLGLGIAALPAALAPAASAACEPSVRILKAPPGVSGEVQAKAINDRGDVVGFASGHAALWRGAKASRAVDLGVPRGYVASEAYGVNDHRVVFGLLYDKKERTFPFRWSNGRMKVLKGPNGGRAQVDVPDRNAINERGQIAATLLVNGNRRAARWSRTGRAQLLPALPGHKWTNAWSINDEGVVSGWSRRLPNDDGENNPVVWGASGRITRLATPPGRADGAAEASNRAGLIVGYTGNLGTDTDPESNQAAVWTSPRAQPRLLGPAGPLAYAELVDVNGRNQAAGMYGAFTEGGFPVATPATWKPGWAGLRPIPLPAKARTHAVAVAQANDINAPGTIVGNSFGLSAPEYSALERIYPTIWKCQFAG